MNRMDVYSIMMVPFQVGAYCRGRRHHPAAVALARAIKKKDEAETEIAAAQKKADEAEAEVVRAVKTVEELMKASGEL